MEFHEAANAFPLMDDARLEELTEDIRQRGQLEPITICDGKILDGRNRYRACLLIGVAPATREYRGDPWAQTWSMNGQRRDLIADQRYLIWEYCTRHSDEWKAAKQAIDDAANRKRSEAAKGNKNASKEMWPCHHCGGDHPIGGPNPCHDFSLNTEPLAADERYRTWVEEDKNSSGTGSSTTVSRHKAKQAKAAASKTNAGAVARGDTLLKNRPDLAEKVRLGEMTSAAAHKQMAKDAENKARKAAAKRLAKTMPSSGIVDHGDFRELGRSVADKSCTLIFTDPPYDRESLPLFESLGEFADRVLVDGGSLVTFCGQYVMDDVMQLLGGHLRYFWVCCCLHTGGTAAMREYGIKVKWKPMLWYVKGTFRYDREVWVDDLVKSQEEKTHHPWQQSVIEARHFVETLTRKGDLVCDPFCGGGTTAVAAKELDRKYWTCDVDARHVATARERLA